ncbi:hypothetical protein [Variovorax rhizosphaerae]|uniref:Uncharacterized protein n=1 Tax=Variovorax rhizosphaerae TaxID=1836200 RepID=A0ABU8WK65_9BURK
MQATLMAMSPRHLSNADISSATAVFDALADRLPQPHRKLLNYSEISISNTGNLKRQLNQGVPIVVSYTNFWLGRWARHAELFVHWTYLTLGCLIVGMLLGFMSGLLKGNNAGGMALLGLSVVAGLGLAIRYTDAQPPMAEQSVTIINGWSNELISACRMRYDEHVDQLVRTPLSDLVIGFSWVQIADSSPSSLRVFLAVAMSAEDGKQDSSSFCLATVYHDYPRAPPEDWVRKAKDFADILGARYVGLTPPE